MFLQTTFSTTWNKAFYRVLSNRASRLFVLLVFVFTTFGNATIPVYAQGMVTLDGAVSSGTLASGSNISVPHTTGTGTDRLMLLGVSWNCGTTNRLISSATFTPDGGSALGLTEVWTQQYNWSTNYRYTAIYSLLNPPSGVTGTVNFTFSGSVSNGIIAGAANFAGVNQTAPLGTPDGAVGTGSSTSGTPNPSLTLTGLAGDELVFDSVFIGASNTSHAMSADSGQSELWNILGYTSGSSFNMRGSASTKQATGASATMSWTTGGYGTTATRWAIAAVPIHPAASGPTHTLTIDKTGTGDGTVDPTVGTHTYAEGTVVTLSASAATNSTFNGWSGDDDCVDGSITMDADKTCTASFSLKQHTLIFVAGTGGTITDPAGASPQSYDYGTVVTITASADSGYHFTNWSGDVGAVANVNTASTTITMDGDYSITANFAAGELVTLDGLASSGTSAPANSSISFNHTTGTGTNRLTLVGVSWNCGSTDTTISSATFTPSGGSATPLTEVKTQQYYWTGSPAANNYRYTAIYSLLAPPSGVTGTIDIGFSGAVSNGIIAGASNFAGVDQATPLGTPDGATGTGTSTSGAPNPAVSLTELTGDELVFDSVFIGANNASHAMTADSGQSELWNILGYTSGSSFNMRSAASTKQTAGTSATMSWTTAGYGSTATRWAIAAVPIRPAPATSACFALTLSHTGNGLDPTASPVKSDGCAENGQYVEGELITLTALPDPGWQTGGWTGTDGPSLNTLTMPANPHTAAVTYTQNTFTLTITSAHGTVTKDPDKTTYTYGEVVQLTATPTPGWSFDNWSGDASGMANPVSVTMDGNKSVTANYSPVTFYFVITSDHGTVTKDPDKATYSYGEVVQLTAIPDDGWVFDHWSGDVTGTDNPVSVTMDSTKAVTANYTHAPCTLTITSAHGTVAKDPDKATYTYGEVVQLTATPTPGWSFDNWSGDASGMANPVNVTMDGNKSVTANYSPVTFYFVITSDHGTVTKDPDKATYSYGEVVQLTATPDDGWVFDHWSGDVTGTDNPVSVTMIGSKVITANFAEGDTTPPVLTITGAIADGNPMAGDEVTGFVLETFRNPAVDHMIRFAEGTVTDEPLADDYFGLKLISSTVSVSELEAYYDARGVPEPYLTYLKTAANGGNPFVYIKGSFVTLVDAAQHDLGSVDVDMTIPDDYPLGTYTVEGVIKDLAGNETTVTLILIVSPGETVHSITLESGWNLVSFNLQPVDTNIAAVLANIAGHYDLVYAWDNTGSHAGSGHWLKYDPTAPGYANTLSALDESMGFWIHMTEADVLEVSGSLPETTNIALSTHAGGWNLVGYPTIANRQLPGALSEHGAGSEFSLVFAYHANDGTDPWKLFDLDAPEWSNDLDELVPGWGYWVLVSADRSWNVAYTAD